MKLFLGWSLSKESQICFSAKSVNTMCEDSLRNTNEENNAHRCRWTLIYGCILDSIFDLEDEDIFFGHSEKNGPSVMMATQMQPDRFVCVWVSQAAASSLPRLLGAQALVTCFDQQGFGIGVWCLEPSSITIVCIISCGSCDWILTGVVCSVYHSECPRRNQVKNGTYDVGIKACHKRHANECTCWTSCRRR